MNMRSAGAGMSSPLPRAMARLARLPTTAAWGWGIISLILVVLADSAGRSAGLRLVPLYVPLLCAIFWALGRWQAIGFAVHRQARAGAVRPPGRGEVEVVR